MINESETNQILKLLNPTQKKRLAAHLNNLSSRSSTDSYSNQTIDKYIETRIPLKLLQPVKRWLLNLEVYDVLLKPHIPQPVGLVEKILRRNDEEMVF